jgi:scyllo-inositol 2-dehydrogenase (NADP+)
VSDAIQTAVIGFGVAGQIFHAAIVHAVPGLELAGIVQRHGDDAAKAYPKAKVYRDAEEAFKDPAIHLVVVATPNESHFDLGSRALAAGKHVVIDKPMTLSSGDANALVDLASKKNRIVSAYQNRRWDGDFRTVQRLLDAGTLGKLISFESHFDRWRPQRKPQVWRESGASGGGILWDLGPHLIDQALVLFGNPTHIFADVRSERAGAVMDDAFDVHLYYPALSVFLRSSCMACVPGARFTLRGTQGSYVKYGLDPQEDALKRGERFESASWGEERSTDWGTLTIDDAGTIVSQPLETERGDYRGYYANVRDAILGREPLAVSGAQAARVIRLLELARESSERRTTLPCGAE